MCQTSMMELFAEVIFFAKSFIDTVSNTFLIYPHGNDNYFVVLAKFPMPIFH